MLVTYPNRAGPVVGSGVIIYGWRRPFLAVAFGIGRGSWYMGDRRSLRVLSAQSVFWGLRAAGVKGCGGIAPVK